ncbi:MAG: hypothetical protein AAF604_24685 [Acidobacteriota bacterium]
MSTNRFNFDIDQIDLTGGSLAPTELARRVHGLEAGRLLQAEVFDPAGAGELQVEIEQVQNRYLAPGVDAYSQFLVGDLGSAGGGSAAIFNWGTAEGEGAEAVDLESFPRLRTFLALVDDFAAALRRPDEKHLLSVVPSLRKVRTFPRFFHRDSHASVDEVRREADIPSCYRMVWDLGLQNSHEVLNVHFVPRAGLLDDDGRVAAPHRALFQGQNFAFREMSDHEIDAVQPQMREASLPVPELQRELVPGRAFVWLDDLFFHTTYLRHGRSVDELQAAPRSILIVRQFAANAQDDIPWSDAVRRFLPG